jgi:hypothetical protein
VICPGLLAQVGFTSETGCRGCIIDEPESHTGRHRADQRLGFRHGT